ncbi:MULTISPECIES: dTDP-4-dehydrorhamnose reductase [unclassified Pseudomonas]|uniref:dTDP-4-dehydrorhamnose reductase n=1 Tax=unclassified Pseudomonas TaxID=196821 RepID=UPI001911D695|nr:MULTISPECIES: dTDP-4-dehydrorhamnose reductase [unclassified Pseudomonas]MBK5553041.1 dTDP-4-dehydrorhamnose reductase [Pseudomonas sp. TH03]MEB0225200.1 dTDP-4-dehydrorhamnose reductase [Pseudomonas sp. 5S1]MEB0293996.1 dTDP-4-dehydrorhamnose reductase [Pseudomonas sp. 10S4]WPX17008.1 dTDP-4-dehydrorhamnose reductase [Pseudomonas sp. 10S4]
MRVLVTGAQGQVGRELLQRVPSGFSVIGYGSGELDISDPAQVQDVLVRTKPQLVINAAAYTAVDKAENEIERAYAVNRDGVTHLALAAEERGIALLHISTDYVFSGDSDCAYKPDDVTAPTGVYGLSKLAGEQQLQQHCSRHLILRTSWVFGVQGNNFVKTMLRLGRDRDELAVVADQRGCPTSAGSIADTLWALAAIFQRDGALKWGLYHYSGEPACTWYDFADEIFSQAQALGLLEKSPSLKAITTAGFPTPAKRPAWSVLDCQALELDYGLAPRSWKRELHQVLQQLS